MGRILALAHSAGATPNIKNDVVRIINYMNREDVNDTTGADPATMEGLDYLVGAKYTKLKDGRIVDGITMENIWKTDGRLLKASNMQLKDTCLSFALFWLLLGKFWSYPLYESNSSSRAKAWRLVRGGLLSEKGGHERVFRVIEIELAFLRDYFHARYIFFYLNGFYWKIISVVALPAMFWWFIHKSITQNQINYADNTANVVGLESTRVFNIVIISIIVALEAMQLVVFLTSRWLKVTFYCLYVKKMASKSTWCISRFFLEFFGSIFLGSSRSSNSAWWRKPWKRELDQYSLIHSCTTFLKSTSYIKLHFISIFGVPLSKPGMKEGKKVVLSDRVKEAVVFCLQRNKTFPKLSNGTESLRRNGIIGMLPEWSSTIQKDTERILVWHIATSVCELHSTTPQSTKADDMKVATELSKYCAYLLFFSPSLLPVPSLEAETICDTVLEDAMTMFKKPIFGCGKEANAVKYEKMLDLIGEEDTIGGQYNILTKGAMLGKFLISLVGEEDKRWKILAEFWAEMILYLAPSNSNEMDHAGKLSQGGQFITQLWALLIHAGISDRDDMAGAFQEDDEE